MATGRGAVLSKAETGYRADFIYNFKYLLSILLVLLNQKRARPKNTRLRCVHQASRRNSYRRLPSHLTHRPFSKICLSKALRR
jgi:hypothetical protein